MRRLLTAVQTSLVDRESSSTFNSISELRSAGHSAEHGFKLTDDEIDTIIVNFSWMLAIFCVVVMAQFGPRTVKGLLCSGTWFVCACVVSVINKVALRRFAAPASLAALHISVAIVVILLNRPWRAMSVELRKERPGVVPCSLLGIVAGMAWVTGLFAQNAEGLRAFVILQNLGPVWVFFLEPWLSPTPSHFALGRCGAFVLVCGGSVLYGGIQDFGKSGPALPYAVISLISMTIYTLGMRVMLSARGFELSVPTIALIQNVCSLLPVLVFFVHGQEWLVLRRFGEGLKTVWKRPYYDAVLLISALVYTGLSVTSVQIRCYLTATNFAVLESAARALQVALALAFFGSRPLSNCLGTVGCAACILGSYLFTRFAQSDDKLPGGEDNIVEIDNRQGGVASDPAADEDEEVRSNVSNVEFDARNELLLGPSDSHR